MYICVTIFIVSRVLYFLKFNHISVCVWDICIRVYIRTTGILIGVLLVVTRNCDNS